MTSTERMSKFKLDYLRTLFLAFAVIWETAQ